MLALAHGRLCTLLLVAGCSEIHIGPKAEDPLLPSDEPADSGTADTDRVPTGCAAATLTLGSWVASAPFAERDGPTDGMARPFHHPAFDASTFSPVTLPDVNGAPAGTDRVYRGVLTVSGSPPSVALDLQSDDGITVWIDGTELGAWGGDWQQEGCVNDDASCGEFEIVAPVDISAQATPGNHTVAARVSNATVNHYADLRVRCEESP